MTIPWNQTLDDGRTVLEHNLDASGQSHRGRVGFNHHRVIDIYSPVAPNTLRKIAEQCVALKITHEAHGPVFKPYGNKGVTVQIPLDQIGIDRLSTSNRRSAALFA